MAEKSFATAEHDVTAYWKKHHIFQRSISERPADRQFTFYDGPPFATGLPHYGHIVASTLKDVVPRYATMRGYRVERRWGWDCHGLPVENLIEKELNLKTKKDIEAVGVAKFNAACRATVLKYVNEWRSTIERIGRWVDMDNDYRTMDASYMESVWWVFKQLYDRGLIYEGKKAMHICPRCETPLSNFEVTLGYKDVDDLAVTWKFKVVGQPNTFLLAWTTTPWSTPGTMGLSVGPDYTYVKVKVNDEYVIVVKERLAAVIGDTPHEIVEELKGRQLVGWQYEPLVDYFKTLPEVSTNPNVYHVFAADYVQVTDGTGIVTINGSYGEIDMRAATTNHLPMVMDVDMNGRFNDLVGPYAGWSVNDGQKKLVEDASQRGLVWRAERYRHSYPHCWRCETPLLNYATNSWFVKVTAIKAQMLKSNDQITWIPDHVKHGRFGKWLEGAKDWAISRERYWGAPLPIWKSDDGDIICLGSMVDLEELSGQNVTDLHKEFVDQIVIERDGKTYRRIGAVLDCWFESGSMPYAQSHYPFVDKAGFEKKFPADFIAEGLDQTRGWFYTLTVLSTALFDQPAFRQVVVNGLVLAEDGKKMSKRLKNYPEPEVVLEKYGADALRFYLMSSPVVRAEDLRFSEKGVDLVMKKVLMTLWNVYTFYSLFATKPVPLHQRPTDVMDRWILALLANRLTTITTAMDAYDIAEATRLLELSVHEVSTWYVRRSRDRFKAADHAEPVAVLGIVLDTLSKMLAPFTPFMAERIYLAMHPAAEAGGDSIHLQSWPELPAWCNDDQLLTDMAAARAVVEQILAQREVAGIKVRQPLTQATVPNLAAIPAELQTVICAEVNVKRLADGESLALDTTITPALAEEGMVRELVRTINALRKQQKLTIQDRVEVIYQTNDALIQTVLNTYAAELQAAVLATTLTAAPEPQEHEYTVNRAKISLSLIQHNR